MVTTFLTQTPQELVGIFSKMPLDVLTARMRRLESRIVKEQAYISEWGERNDLNSDQSWVNQKIDAADNLIVWDAMKAARDSMK